ncbi:hypothetical protein JOM56_015493 [Amanita muscaria]
MACICGSRYCDHELSVRETPPTSRTGQTVSVMNQPPIPSPLSAIFSAARFPRFPPPAASNLSTGQERQRQAGRIEYKADPEYLPSQATQSQARSPTKQPQVDPALQCAIIPFRAIQIVKPTSLKSNTHPPGLFKFDDEDCCHLVRELASYNLIFDLDESGIESEDGEVWETLDMQIKTLLELHQIEMLSSWKFCVPGCSNKYKAETPLQYKCNIAYVWVLLVIHAVLTIVPTMGMNPNRVKERMHTEIETDQLSVSQLPALHEPSTHSGPQRPGPRGRPSAASNSPSYRAASNAATPPPVEHLKNQDAPVIDRLTSAEVDSWRRDIQTHPRVGNTGVYIRAPDSETLAQTLIALLQLQASDKQSTAGFEPAQGVVVRVPDITSLMNAFPLFQMKSKRGLNRNWTSPRGV